MARHQALILDFYGFRPFKPHGQAILVEEIARLVRSQLKPRLIFSRSVETLVREKVEVPDPRVTVHPRGKTAVGERQPRRVKRGPV